MEANPNHSKYADHLNAAKVGGVIALVNFGISFDQYDPFKELNFWGVVAATILAVFYAVRALLERQHQ
jgi:hypothetical protein